LVFFTYFILLAHGFFDNVPAVAIDFFELFVCENLTRDPLVAEIVADGSGHS